MSKNDRKAQVRGYKESVPPAGIYRIRNRAAGKSLVGMSADITSILNRHRFQLDNGSFPDAELQRDWTSLGADRFDFETVDLLKPKDEPGYDPKPELVTLKALWMEKFSADGEQIYARSRLI